MNTLRERFDEKWKICPDTGCWIWIASRLIDGYGKIKVAGIPARAHRVSWELYRGPIPEGICVLHHCDTPPCVRPDCLFLGTMADNNADRDAKGRTVVPQGEQVGLSKLTAPKVMKIRFMYSSGGITQVELGAIFGVHNGVISRIINRKAWAHVH